MLDFPTWKRVWLWAVTLLAIAAALPSLASIAGVRWPSVLPNPTVNLGLDLAGGSHILLEADKRQVGQQRLENMEESVRGRLKAATPSIAIGDISSSDGALIACTRPQKCPVLLPRSRNQRPPGHASSFIGIGFSGVEFIGPICSRIVSNTISIGAAISSSFTISNA